MSDEEKKAIERLIIYKDKIKDELYPIIDFEEEKAIGIILNLIEKQSKEIEEAEQKEKKAYIDGTNVAHELCNKMWKDKIKAQIEELEKIIEFEKPTYEDVLKYAIEILQELLEEE